jgi:BCD family chlorophyll transporter-like MFS transporter
MMGLAGAGKSSREGIRMGVWGAAQAVAFAAGGFFGALGVDIGRRVLGQDSSAFLLVFVAEAALFLASAVIAYQIRGVGAVAQAPETLDVSVGSARHVQA